MKPKIIGSAERPNVPGLIPLADALDEWIDLHADPSIKLAWSVYKQQLEHERQVAAMTPPAPARRGGRV